MSKLLKYDFKTNKKYFFRTIFINLILVILAFILNRVLDLREVLNSLSFLIFYLGLSFFVLINLIYIFISTNKDYNKARSLLTFSLPVSENSYMASKNLGVILVYGINLIFLLVFLSIFNFKISKELVLYFILGLIWIIIFTNLVLLIMQKTRFRQNKRPFLRVFGLFILIMGLAYIINKYGSIVIVNGSIQHARPMDYAFIFPFALGDQDLYTNISPFVYYILAWIFTYKIDVANLRKNLDLS